MNTVHIRPIERADAAAAAGVVRAAWLSNGCAVLAGEDEQIAGDSNRAVLVASLDDEVVGWIDLASNTTCNQSPLLSLAGWCFGVDARAGALGCGFRGRLRIGPGRGALHGCGSDRMRSGSAHMLFICGMGMRG